MIGIKAGDSPPFKTKKGNTQPVCSEVAVPQFWNMSWCPQFIRHQFIPIIMYYKILRRSYKEHDPKIKNWPVYRHIATGGVMQKVCSTKLDHFLKGHVRKNSLLHFRCNNKADSGAINVCRCHILGIFLAITTKNNLECTKTV